MQKLTIPSYSYAAKSYCLLTKPGIILGNVITTAGGFALAAQGNFPLLLFCATMLGLSLIIGSACVFNNYIDRVADEKMDRTKNRALARGDIPAKNALIFGAALGVLGAWILFQMTNLNSCTVSTVEAKGLYC